MSAAVVAYERCESCPRSDETVVLEEFCWACGPRALCEDCSAAHRRAIHQQTAWADEVAA